MYINDKMIHLDVPAQIYNSRTFVPLQALSEVFGANVCWNEQRLIEIMF